MRKLLSIIVIGLTLCSGVYATSWWERGATTQETVGVIHKEGSETISGQKTFKVPQIMYGIIATSESLSGYWNGTPKISVTNSYNSGESYGVKVNTKGVNPYGTNYGIYVDTSGSTIENYALYINSGKTKLGTIETKTITTTGNLTVTGSITSETSKATTFIGNLTGNADTASTATNYVLKAGDTMTGTLTNSAGASFGGNLEDTNQPQLRLTTIGDDTSLMFSAVGIDRAQIYYDRSSPSIKIAGPEIPSGANDIVTFKNTGNVGIGTTEPSSKLTVNGTIETITGGIKYPDGSTQTSSSGNRMCITFGSEVLTYEAGGTGHILKQEGNFLTATHGILMPRAGSITGISSMKTCFVKTTNGLIKTAAYINNVWTGFYAENTITATGEWSGYAVQARGLDTFVAGDFITIAAYTPTVDGFVGTISMENVFMEIVFDN